MSKLPSIAMGDAPHPEKKRKFSLFRARNSEPVVTVIPVVDSLVTDASSSQFAPVSATPSTSEAPRPSYHPESIHSLLSTASTCAPIETNKDGQSAYAGATHPSAPVTYTFQQSSPFAMVLSPENVSKHPDALYHVSVGINVWMPSLTVTTVRRGSREDGPVVASVE
jgi:hypothetical protein